MIPIGRRWLLLAVGAGQSSQWCAPCGTARRQRGLARADAGFAPVATIAAAPRSTATIISPQYLVWLLPFAGRRGGRRRDYWSQSSSWLLRPSASSSSARIDDLDREEMRSPSAIVLIRNVTLLGLLCRVSPSLEDGRRPSSSRNAALCNVVSRTRRSACSSVLRSWRCPFVRRHEEDDHDQPNREARGGSPAALTVTYRHVTVVEQDECE